MDELTVSEARAHLADVVDAARVDHRPVFLTRRGRRIAAVVDADDLQALIESAEDAADVLAANEARASLADEPTVPLEEIMAELGLA
jgi:prevent-host-death family protein